MLELCRKQQCCVTGCNRRAQAAHIKSRGAGGGDHASNLCPLCWEHHMDQHNLGWARFRGRHPEVMSLADIYHEYHRCFGCVGSNGDCSSAFEVGLKVCEGYQEG